MMEKGYIHIYTGDGKGKITAALGLAVRACGRGLRVVYRAVYERASTMGKLTAIKYLPGVEVEQFGSEAFITKDQDVEFHRAMAQKGMARMKTVFKKNAHDIVIMDEIIVAVWFGLISEKEVLTLIQDKPRSTELILTGRRASDSLMETADLVTEMNEIRHYYNTMGLTSREGIEN